MNVWRTRTFVLLKQIQTVSITLDRTGVNVRMGTIVQMGPQNVKVGTKYRELIFTLT